MSKPCVRCGKPAYAIYCWACKQRCPKCGHAQHDGKHGDCPELPTPRYALTEAGRRVHNAISQAEREILAGVRNSRRKMAEQAPTNGDRPRTKPHGENPQD